MSTAARGRRRVTTQFLAEVEEILREVLVSKGDFDRVLVRQPVLAAKEERGLVDVQPRGKTRVFVSSAMQMMVSAAEAVDAPRARQRIALSVILACATHVGVKLGLLKLAIAVESEHGFRRFAITPGPQ